MFTLKYIFQVAPMLKTYKYLNIGAFQKSEYNCSPHYRLMRYHETITKRMRSRVFLLHALKQSHKSILISTNIDMLTISPQHFPFICCSYVQQAISEINTVYFILRQGRWPL